MPRFSEAFNGPKDYSSIFSSVPGLRDAPIIRSLDAFVETIRESDLLRYRLLPPNMNDSEWGSDDVREFMVGRLVYNAVDRYVHTEQTAKFSEDGFLRVFEPIERGVFEDRLSVDIMVPILFINFDFDELRVSSTAVIRRMSSDIQCARSTVMLYGPGVHESVLESATHALVIENQVIENDGPWYAHQVASEVEAYPVDLIDAFFGALRCVTGEETGYAQMLRVPRGWMHEWSGGLPSVTGTSTRAYPNRFENFYWLKAKLPVLDATCIGTVAELWRTLSAVKETRLNLAIRRLNMCFLRDRDDDIAVDATIGLEAVLGDKDPREMTHKLAMRLGALAPFFVDFRKTPFQAFREIKRVYAYRSSVVHGDSNAEQKSEMAVSENETESSSRLALRYLRAVVRVLAEKAEFRDPNVIDKTLLLGERDPH